MSHLPFQLHKRNAATTMVVASVVLLGCAAKTQIQVPQGFHGTVHILCSGSSADRTANIRVDGTGSASVTNCPMRQTDAVVTRDGGATPVSTAVMWTTTGDGLVREINFDVR